MDSEYFRFYLFLKILDVAKWADLIAWFAGIFTLLLSKLYIYFRI